MHTCVHERSTSPPSSEVLSGQNFQAVLPYTPCSQFSFYLYFWCHFTTNKKRKGKEGFGLTEKQDLSHL
jgi:hypothetical protein